MTVPHLIPAMEASTAPAAFAAVRANGVAVEYLLFPNEGHGFTKRENRIKASDAFVSFLDKQLKKVGRAAHGDDSTRPRLPRYPVISR